MPVKVPGRPKPWKVEVPARFSSTGSRQRVFFDTKAAAKGFAEKQQIKLANFGTQGGGVLSPSETEQAANALALLEPHGVSLNEVVHDWLRRKQAAAASITYEVAMDAFKESRLRSDSYIRSIRQTKNRLSGLHGRLLNEITPADLNREMDGMTPSVRNLTIRILGGLFNFGIKRDYCSENPTKKLDLSQREAVEIEVYSPIEVGKIFEAAEQHDVELLPFLTISFFAGVRLSEMLRLDWSAVDLQEGFVKLPAAITKTKRGRHINLGEGAIAWLTPYAQDGGRVTPWSHDVLRNRLERLRVQHKVRTIKHGARHCFASYWLAQHGDINQLCLFLGHDDPETTFKHYAKAATKRDAVKFFAILPRLNQKRNVIPFVKKR